MGFKEIFAIALVLFILAIAGCTGSTQAATDIPVPSTGTPPASSPAVVPQSPEFTISEVSQHTQLSDCWMAIDGKVLNLSSFSGHPGGEAYVPYCGTDATAVFYSRGENGEPHSDSAVSMLADYQIGVLKSVAR